MTFLQRLKNGVSRFMYGRNGADHLGLGLLWTAILLEAVSWFVRSDAAHHVISLASSALLLWEVFRLFSKNLYARRRENAWFLTHLWQPVRDKLSRARDKEHKYFACPNCHTVCRVPRGKGKIIITCPKCGGEIHGKS